MLQIHMLDMLGLMNAQADFNVAARQTMKVNIEAGWDIKNFGGIFWRVTSCVKVECVKEQMILNNANTNLLEYYDGKSREYLWPQKYYA